MKWIVDLAKPVAERVIQLKPSVLTPDDQSRLATWLALSAVMRDQRAIAHPQKMQRAALEHLQAAGRAPGNFFIGIGAFLGPKSVADSYNVRLARSTAPPYDVQSSLHSIAVSMGGLFAVVLAPWNLDPALIARFPTLYGDTLTQIWPKLDRNFGWPNYGRKIVTGAFKPDDPGSAYALAYRAREAYTAHHGIKFPGTGAAAGA